MKNKKYLITGGLGFIGSTLANKLQGDITIIARSKTHADRIKNKSAHIVFKNLNELSKENVEGIDVIYHLASTVSNYNVLTDPYIDTETNVIGTTRLLELCKDLKKKPLLIYTSTFFVYGHEYDETGIPINEKSKTNPLGIYPATKLCAENIIKLYSRLYNIPHIICRFTNVYGASEGFDDPKKAAFNFMIMKALKGEEIKLYDGGNFFRDYIYVDDAVDAMIFLEEKIPNDTFLIGYGKPVKFKEMFDHILKQTEKIPKIESVAPPAFHDAVGIKNFVADTSKINKLGWSAQIDYQCGIQKVIDYYKSLA